MRCLARFLRQRRLQNADFTTKQTTLRPPLQLRRPRTQRTRRQNGAEFRSSFVFFVSLWRIYALSLVVVQRLCRVQLVPRLYMRIGQAEGLPDQVEGDRHKPTYREIDELPDTNISGVT
jgi:hypothetical protein